MTVHAPRKSEDATGTAAEQDNLRRHEPPVPAAEQAGAALPAPEATAPRQTAAAAGGAEPHWPAPGALARLHGAAFARDRGWSTDEIAALLADPACFLVHAPDSAGFALGRAVADEAELLTLAVAADRRRSGHGAALLAAFEAAARGRGAARAFLEVAADNAPALALYDRAGFVPCGRRRGYYKTAAGERIDALVLGKALARRPDGAGG